MSGPRHKESTLGVDFARIKEALDGGPLTSREIATVTGMKSVRITMMLCYARGLGVVSSEERKCPVCGCRSVTKWSLVK